jgi:hypothetical protein
MMTRLARMCIILMIGESAGVVPGACPGLGGNKQGDQSMAAVDATTMMITIMISRTRRDI